MRFNYSIYYDSRRVTCDFSGHRGILNVAVPILDSQITGVSDGRWQMGNILGFENRVLATRHQQI